MWPGFDPQLKRDLENIRQMVRLTHQTPTREWPLVFDHAHDQLLVVREWPDGSVTAYMVPSSELRKRDSQAG